MSFIGPKPQKATARAQRKQMNNPAPLKPKRQPRNRNRGESSRTATLAGNLTSRKEKVLGSGFGSSRRRQVIVEDEYIGDIYGSVAFATSKFPFNPGQSTTFPWASRIAANYERYRVINAEFYYKRMVSEYAANGQTGKVIMSFDYDASDPLPINKQQVEDTVPHVDCLPSEEMALRLDPAMLNSQDSKYVRPGALPANSDIKTYDGGNLFVSTVGNNSTAVVGELHVKYIIELLVPILEILPATNGGSIVSGGTVSAANPLGSLPAPATNNAGITVDNASNITFANVGTYLVAVYLAGSGSPSTTLTNVSGSVCTDLVAMQTSSAQMSDWQVVTTTPNAVVSFTGSNTVTSSEVYIGLAPSTSL